MDLLSDVITAMRTGRPHSARTRKHDAWGVAFQPFAGAGFHVVLQGVCWLFPPAGAPVALGAGDVVFLPHGSGHGLAGSPSASLTGAPPASLTRPEPESATSPPSGAAATTELLCGGYVLERSRPHPLLGELPDVIHLPARRGHHQPLRTAVDLLGGELEQPCPGTDAVVPALLDMLLLYTLRAWFEERQRAEPHAASGWAAALGDPAVTAALHAIHRDPARPWTVGELGAQANLSRAAFARRFTALVGQPPLTYLTWWRMTVAARLLRDTGEPLATVAKQVGYTSEYAFANAFRRAHGIAAGRFRREQQP